VDIIILCKVNAPSHTTSNFANFAQNLQLPFVTGSLKILSVTGAPCPKSSLTMALHSSQQWNTWRSNTTFDIFTSVDTTLVPMALLKEPTLTSDNPSSKPLTVIKLSGPLVFIQSFGQSVSQFISEWAVCPISQLQDHIPSFLLTSPKLHISNHLLIPSSPPPTSFPDKQSPYRNNLITLKHYI
jgi:hypothetical protein